MSRITNLIMKDLEERIKNKDNIVFQIKGTTNKGMSESTLELAKRFNTKEAEKNE